MIDIELFKLKIREIVILVRELKEEVREIVVLVYLLFFVRFKILTFRLEFLTFWIKVLDLWNVDQGKNYNFYLSILWLVSILLLIRRRWELKNGFRRSYCLTEN